MEQLESQEDRLIDEMADHDVRNPEPNENDLEQAIDEYKGLND